MINKNYNNTGKVGKNKILTALKCIVNRQFHNSINFMFNSVVCAETSVIPQKHAFLITGIKFNFTNTYFFALCMRKKCIIL